LAGYNINQKFGENTALLTKIMEDWQKKTAFLEQQFNERFSAYVWMMKCLAFKSVDCGLQLQG
jgi:hypothetical protein